MTYGQPAIRIVVMETGCLSQDHNPKEWRFSMNYGEAKNVPLMHGSGTYDASGEPVALDDGFLGSLRPFKGLIENNFHLVMESLLTAGDEIYRSPQVDRDLVESLWSMRSLARSWGVSPDGMLQRNKLITPADTSRLELWIDIVERTALGLLIGCPPHSEVERYAQYVIDVGWRDNIDFFVPLMVDAVEDADNSDPSVVAEALGKLGRKARSALPALSQAVTRTYSWYSPEDKCTEEVRGHIRQAIQNIENAE